MRKATVDPVRDEQPMTASQDQFNLVALSRVLKISLQFLSPSPLPPAGHRIRKPELARPKNFLRRAFFLPYNASLSKFPYNDGLDWLLLAAYPCARRSILSLCLALPRFACS
jgi:hypothetical protein